MKRTAALKTLGELSTPEARLKASCEQLNKEKDRECGQVLVKFIKEWIPAASLEKMSPENRFLFADMRRSVEPYLDTSQTKKWGVWRVHLKQQPDIMDPHGFAVWWLSFFFDNPVCEKLAGPCARCGNYFIKKRASQNVYCSRRCGNQATAVARNRERIEEERNDKLLRARAALRDWRSATTREDWKHWVAKRSGVDQRFLTRAANLGDLVPPQKGK
jgi:hypothetical protein